MEAATKPKCPDCGHTMRTVETVRGPVYFVDRYCDNCGLLEVDEQGGI